MSRHVAAAPPFELQASILGVVLSAESARSGFAALLEALRPITEDATLALAVRDRDGTTLHVLAEVGEPCAWPTSLNPRVVANGEHVIDSTTNAMVLPLSARGRVCAALLFADPDVGRELLNGETLPALVEPIAEVVHALLTATDAEVRRRAHGLRSIEHVIDGMAHQIANPLTGASALAQLLGDELTDPDQRASLLQIRHELTRAFTVVADLLDFHRDTRAHDGILDLNAVVERVVRFRGYSIREQGISLDLQVLPEYAPVRVDSRGLEHALLQVLTFAEQQSHGTVNRAIEVRVAERSARELAVEITDSGLGRAPELAPRYFDLSYNEQPTRGDEEAPDLGLVDGILRACGGSLQVASSKTSGTTLTLVLPRAVLSGSQTNARTRA